MKKVTFKQYKAAYDNFWKPGRKVTVQDIQVMVRLINERSKNANKLNNS